MQHKQRTRFHNVVLSHLREVKGSLILAGLCMLGFTLIQLLAPWPLKLIFDHVLLDEPFNSPFLVEIFSGGKVIALIVFSLSIIAIALVGGFFAYSQLYLTSRIGNQMVHTLRTELFSHLQRLSLSFHDRARSGELLTKVISDTKALKDVFAESVLTLATQLVTFVAMFTVMFIMNWKLSLIVLVTMPILSYAILYLYREVRISAKNQRRKEGKVAARISEILMTMPLIQIFGRQRFEEERFEAESAHNLHESIRTARLGAALTRVVEVISAFGTGIVILFGSLQVLKGRMTPGAILVFASYVQAMYSPIRKLARISTKFSSAMASVERVSTILEMDPEVEDEPHAIEASNLKGEIVFEDVFFDYGDGKPVLQNISFTAAAGQRVALIGASGAGKSTIVSLILRLYNPSAGSILVDGVEIRKYQHESVRQEITLVPQNSILFGTSIWDNIAYGKPHATAEDVEAAARAANAHDFIMAFPDGYDTQLGERGETLSGGQRQRLAIARAMIRDTPVVILDEPLTGLDATSAKIVMEALERLMEGKTVIIITHQLYTIQKVDKIVVLDKGRIIQQGTHDNLIVANGKYRRLYHTQLNDVLRAQSS